MKFKKGDIVVQRTNELTVVEVVGVFDKDDSEDIVHCTMSNGQPVQLQAGQLIPVDLGIIKDAGFEVRKMEEAVGLVFKKPEPVAPVSVAKEVEAQ